MSDVRVSVDTSQVVGPVNPLVLGQNAEWYDFSLPFLWDGEELSAQTLDQVRSLGATSFRFPGGHPGDFFVWDEAIGPREQRRSQLNPFADKHVEPFLGPDEVLGMARATGGTPWFQTNPVHTDSDSVARWAAHCRERGVPVPHWEIGNEIYLASANKKEDHTSDIYMLPGEYVRRAREHLDALRSAEPDALVGIIGGRWTYRGMDIAHADWNEVVLREMGADVDFLAIHTVYGPVIGDPSFWGDVTPDKAKDAIRAACAGGAFARHSLDINLALVDEHAPGADLKLAVTEWLPWFGVVPNSLHYGSAMGAAMYTSGVLNVFLSESRVLAAHFMSFVQGGFGAAMLIDFAGGRTVPSVNHAVLGMYARHLGDEVVGCTVDAETFDSPDLGVFGPHSGIAYVDALATRSDSGGTVFLTNRDLDSARTVHLVADLGARSVRTRCVSAHYLDVNPPAAGAHLRTRAEDDLIAESGGPAVKGDGPWTLDLPPCSVTAVIFES